MIIFSLSFFSVCVHRLNFICFQICVIISWLKQNRWRRSDGESEKIEGAKDNCETFFFFYYHCFLCDATAGIFSLIFMYIIHDFKAFWFFLMVSEIFQVFYLLYTRGVFKNFDRGSKINIHLKTFYSRINLNLPNPSSNAYPFNNNSMKKISPTYSFLIQHSNSWKRIKEKRNENKTQMNKKK